VYKQVFDLTTGICLDDETVVVRSWPARVVDGMVEVEEAGST
jgi:nitrite reductase (NADH) small subunit